MQDLLYEMPDTKTQKTPRDKNWARIPQPNAAAQTLGVRGVNYTDQNCDQYIFKDLVLS